MPNVIQSLWVGSHLPALQVLSLRSFLAHGHEYHLYAFGRPENTPPGVTVIDAESILPRDSVFTYQHGFGKGSYSAFSNQFRYQLLFDKGGWWVDTDVVCLCPFDFAADFVFATERDPNRRVSAASCVIKSPSGADYLRYCLDVCASKNKDAIAWGEIGPRLMSEAIERFDLGRHCVPPHVFNPIDYSSFGEILEPGFDLSRISNSHAVHLWNQKWTTHYLDQDFDGAPDSLYAHLRRQYQDPSERTGDLATHLWRHIGFQHQSLDALQKERDELQWRVDGAAGHMEALQQEAHALRKDLDAERQRLAAAQGELARSAAQLRALQSSISWRLTSPLRAAFDASARALRRRT